MPKKARILLCRTVKKILQKFDIAPVIHYFIYGGVSPEWPAAPPFSLYLAVSSRIYLTSYRCLVGLEGINPIGLEGTMPIGLEGTPPLRGEPYPTL